ncbi:MAG TPA: DedA family protein [Gemmatimonadales bacterium]|jgi:membrane protein DedA with SNARE-associated domain|nr:DedA family protein [Gemmatimonadales bacterium]
MHDHLQQLLIQHGLLAILIGSAFEGDFTLLLAGVVAHLGIFPFPLAVGAGAVGSLVGDSLWYGFGRLRGPKFREGKLYRRVGPTVDRLARRLGPWELLAARFVYGTKAASMLFWGLHGLSVPRFLLIDALGCIIGSFVFTGAGYLVSGSATVLLGRVKRVQLWLLGALIVGVVIVYLINRTAKHELHLDEDGRTLD